MNEILDLVREVGISGFLDIAFMFLIIYSVLVWFKQTRAAFVVTGMLIIGAAYLIARQLDLSLTTTVFQGFFAIILIASVVIFQEEIKHFFEQVASRSALRNLKVRRTFNMPRTEIETLVRTLLACSQDSIGALIVLRGRDPILRHIEVGQELNGRMSEPLLRSIFDPNSIGHDGAVVIEDDIVAQFSCHLPLSKNLEKVQRSGTRHAAALGLSELTDAMCLVVSEERGTISVANHGDIKEVRGADELTTLLETFYQRVYPAQRRKPIRDFFRRNYKEKAIALFATIVLWILLVQGAKIEYRTFRVTLEITNVPPHLVVKEAHPNEVNVVFSGSKRAFYFMNSGEISGSLQLFGADEGIVGKSLSRINFTFPEGIALENIDPNEITVHLIPDSLNTGGN